jgi:hypothetical protein
MKTKVSTANCITNGVQSIETAVIKSAYERGLQISEDNFVWNDPASKSTSFIGVYIIANARIAGLFLPRECYEESADGIKRVEVWDAIHDCINALLGSIGQRQLEPAIALN